MPSKKNMVCSHLKENISCGMDVWYEKIIQFLKRTKLRDLGFFFFFLILPVVNSLTQCFPRNLTGSRRLSTIQP